MKQAVINLEELEMINGGDFLGIGKIASYTYNTVIKPVGSFVVDNVQRVVEFPFKYVEEKSKELTPPRIIDTVPMWDIPKEPMQ